MQRLAQVTLFLAVLALGSAARAERDLAQAIDLVLQEVTYVEQEVGAAALPGSPIAKKLLRGKKSLAEGLSKHRSGQWKGAGLGFAKGLGRLYAAFESHGSTSGQVAVEGVFEELEQIAAAALPDLRARFEALPGSADMFPLRRKLSECEFFVTSYHEIPYWAESRGALIDGYVLAGRLGKKIAKLESKGKVDIAHNAKLIPGNLPRVEYSIATETNGVPSLGVYWTRPNTPKLQKQAMKGIIQGIAENRVDGRTCTESCTATPFDGTTFTITVVLTCTTGGNTTVVFTVRKVA